MVAIRVVVVLCCAVALPLLLGRALRAWRAGRGLGAVAYGLGAVAAAAWGAGRGLKLSGAEGTGNNLMDTACLALLISVLCGALAARKRRPGVG